MSKNLDFCPSCEEKVDHPYAFLKIYKQEQVPSAMFTVIDESMPDAHADIEQDVGDGPVPQLFGMPNPVPVEFKQEEDDEEDLYSWRTLFIPIDNFDVPLWNENEKMVNWLILIQINKQHWK